MSYNFTDDSSYWRQVYNVQGGQTVDASASGGKKIALNPTLFSSGVVSSDPAYITGFRPGSGGSALALDYVFMDLVGVGCIYNGGNPFTSAGGSYLSLIQSGSDTSLVLNYRNQQQTIAVLVGVQTSQLTSNNFYSYIIGQYFASPLLISAPGPNTLVAGHTDGDTLLTGNYSGVTLNAGAWSDLLRGVS
jgi:hypothetical protein